MNAAIYGPAYPATKRDEADKADVPDAESVKRQVAGATAFY